MNWSSLLFAYIVVGSAMNFYRAGKGTTKRTRGDAIESGIACALLAWWVVEHA